MFTLLRYVMVAALATACATEFTASTTEEVQMVTGAEITTGQINHVRIYYAALVNDPDPAIAARAQSLIDKCDQADAGGNKARTFVAQEWNSLVDQGLITP